MSASNYCNPDIEWEVPRFPLSISQLNFEKDRYHFSQDTVIKIQRDENFVLSGEISGTTGNPAAFKENNYSGKGNILTGETVTGTDIDGNFVELSGVIVHGLTSNSWEWGENGGRITLKIIINRVSVINPHIAEKTEAKRLNWYLCQDFHADFDRTTRRTGGERIRLAENQQISDVRDYSLPCSTSCDYTIVKYEGNEFIISKVPEKILTGGRKGICIEQNDSPGKTKANNTRAGLEHFISFMAGTKLLNTGYSILTGNEVKESVYYNADEFSLMISRHPAMPPVRFTRRYEWGNFPRMLNTYFPLYMAHEKAYRLNNIISRFFIARCMPVGTNLPVLANITEVICNKYLKTKKLSDGCIVSDKIFAGLIKEELEMIKEKISHVNGHEAIIRRMRVANKRSISEKMKFCFSELCLSTGKAENEALQLRNIMAHGLKTYENTRDAHDDVILSRVYHVLFNRLFLRILGYSEYYTDYSTQRSPYRHITACSGEK